MIIPMTCPNCKGEKDVEIPDEVFTVWPEFDVKTCLIAQCLCGGKIRMYVAQFIFKEEKLTCLRRTP
jgi:hypothetical protein